MLKKKLLDLFHNLLPNYDRFFYNSKNKSVRRNFFSVLIAIIISLLLSFVIITALGTKPLAFFSIFTKAFELEYDAQNFIVQMCIYIIAALAFSFSMKVGVFNIGISGQMLAGASTAFLIINNAFSKDANVPGGQIITILLSIIGASFVALIIGLLKIYLKVNEVVSAIILNWLVLFIVGALIFKFNLDVESYENGGSFKSLPLNQSFTFFKYSSRIGWEWTIIVTFICVISIWIILKFTTFGHKLKTSGSNPFAAQNFGYNKNLYQLASFGISGILSGILAVIVYTAYPSKALDLQGAGGIALNTLPIQGFNGIAVGLISLNNPLAIVLVSFIFTFPNTAASAAGLPDSSVQLVVGVMMYLVAIYSLLSYFKPWRYLIALKYKKINLENYSNLENSIFEINEEFNFLNKNKLIEIAVKKSENKHLKFKLFYIFFNKLIFIFDKEYKAFVLENKKRYLENRNSLIQKFNENCLNKIFDDSEQSLYKLSEKNMKLRWQKDKKIINTLIKKVSSTEAKQDFEAKLNNFKNKFDENINRG